MGMATAPNAPSARPAAPIGPAMASSPDPAPRMPPAAPRPLPRPDRCLLTFLPILSKIAAIPVAPISASAFAPWNPARVEFFHLTVIWTTLSANSPHLPPPYARHDSPVSADDDTLRPRRSAATARR